MQGERALANLAQGIEAEAGEEQVLFAVVGEHYSHKWDDPEPNHLGHLLPWADARKILDYNYDNGFGGADCHPVYAWTETKVIFVVEYDGSTGTSWVPRNPTACEPQFSGKRY